MSYLLNRIKFKSSWIIFTICNSCNKYNNVIVIFFIGTYIKQMFSSVITYDETFQKQNFMSETVLSAWQALLSILP